jgi:hypothetical protein
MMTERRESWSPNLLLEHLMAVLEANDKRYQERFAAQEKAVKEALASQEKAVNAALAASEKAVAVAEENAQRWRNNANEWRSAMTDREKAFAKVEEVLNLKERLDSMSGSSKGMRDLWGWILAGLVAIYTFFKK